MKIRSDFHSQAVVARTGERRKMHSSAVTVTTTVSPARSQHLRDNRRKRDQVSGMAFADRLSASLPHSDSANEDAGSVCTQRTTQSYSSNLSVSTTTSASSFSSASTSSSASMGLHCSASATFLSPQEQCIQESPSVTEDGCNHPEDDHDDINADAAQNDIGIRIDDVPASPTGLPLAAPRQDRQLSPTDKRGISNRASDNEEEPRSPPARRSFFPRYWRATKRSPLKFIKFASLPPSFVPTGHHANSGEQNRRTNSNAAHARDPRSSRRSTSDSCRVQTPQNEALRTSSISTEHDDDQSANNNNDSPCSQQTSPSQRRSILPRHCYASTPSLPTAGREGSRLLAHRGSLDAMSRKNQRGMQCRKSVSTSQLVCRRSCLRQARFSGCVSERRKSASQPTDTSSKGKSNNRDSTLTSSNSVVRFDSNVHIQIFVRPMEQYASTDWANLFAH